MAPSYKQARVSSLQREDRSGSRGRRPPSRVVSEDDDDDDDVIVTKAKQRTATNKFF